MGNLVNRSETFGGGDYRGLRSSRGTAHPKSGSADISTFTAGTSYPDGYLPALLPLKFNDTSGLYEQADAADTAVTLAGFLWHDHEVVPGNDPTIAVLTDATIVAEFIPGDHDLVDGRYLTDQVPVATDPGGAG